MMLIHPKFPDRSRESSEYLVLDRETLALTAGITGYSVSRMGESDKQLYTCHAGRLNVDYFMSRASFVTRYPVIDRYFIANKRTY